MAFNFACVVVENAGTEQSSEILNLITIRSLEKGAGLFSLNDQLSNDEVLVTKVGDRFLIVGKSIFDLYDKLCAPSPRCALIGKPTMYLVVQLESADIYGIAYFEKGRPGFALQVGGGKSWFRYFRQEELPVPDSVCIKSTLEDLADLLRVDKRLINRVYTGMYGKGHYGIGYRSDSDKWVMCKKFDAKIDPNQLTLQELNPNSYKPKGKTFEKTLDPALNRSFFSKTELSYEINHLVLNNLIGCRLDRNGELTSQDIFEKHKVAFDTDLYIYITNTVTFGHSVA